MGIDKVGTDEVGRYRMVLIHIIDPSGMMIIQLYALYCYTRGHLWLFNWWTWKLVHVYIVYKVLHKCTSRGVLGTCHSNPVLWDTVHYYPRSGKKKFAVKIISWSRPTAKVTGDDQWVSLRASPHSPRWMSDWKLQPAIPVSPDTW